MAETVKSNNFSFVGWNWKLWLKGNKEAFKLVLSALFGLWIPVTPELKLLSGAVLKLFLDTVDYWVSEVETKNP
jgi:hypothetical protein